MNIDDILRDPLSFGTDAPIHNMVMLSDTSLEPKKLEALVLAVADAWLKTARARSISPVTFYCWCDEMAGQLRFSIAPCKRTELPFGAQLELIDNLEPIIARFRESGGGFIPAGELEEIAVDEEVATPPRGPLKVFVRTTLHAV